MSLLQPRVDPMSSDHLYWRPVFAEIRLLRPSSGSQPDRQLATCMLYNPEHLELINMGITASRTTLACLSSRAPRQTDPPRGGLHHRLPRSARPPTPCWQVGPKASHSDGVP
ncbi:unnamed protein product [Protopolystoma xenopodis]|uniref:Uncharacterized protein n=1 Tax=Protopolystoma xenopodis TaxID=117903 RepID=A0A3S5B0T4_9PLAT|nr:unnamed protein product [Protopolystoma xenopodis]